MAGKRMVQGRMTRELLKIKDQLSGMRKSGVPASEAAATLATDNFDARVKEQLVELRLLNRDLLHEIERMKGTEDQLKKHLKVTENLMVHRIEQLQKDFEAVERNYRELEKSHSELAHSHGVLEQAHDELKKAFSELENAYKELKAQRNTSRQEHLMKERIIHLKADSILPEESEYNPMEHIAGIKAFWMGPDGRIMQITPTGTITAWSPAAESLCGYTADEVKDLPISILIPRKDYDRFCQDIKRACYGSVILNTVFVKKNGEQVKVSLKLSPLKDNQENTTGVSVDAIALL